MKKISKYKKKYCALDFFKILLLFFGHIFLWFFFLLLIYFFHYLINDKAIWEIYNDKKIFIIFIIISSVISFILHAIYFEKGWTNIKAILWIYSSFVIISSFISFVFF